MRGIGSFHFTAMRGPAKVNVDVLVPLHAQLQQFPIPIDIGINKKDREQISHHISRLLADTYSLYLKTHCFHWNVTGPHFSSLHVMFETQYNELWTAADKIAERIRALGIMAPGSYSQFGKLTSIKEESGVPGWKNMIEQLVEGHDTAAATCNKNHQGDRERWRRRHCRPGHRAAARARENCLDAALDA